MFDRYKDLSDHIDRQLLVRREPPCHADARRLLEAKGIVVRQIVRVDPDSVLFVNGGGKPMTAWMRTSAPGSEVLLVYEPGFAAERSVTLDDGG